MKVITGVSILTTAEGQRITYTYSIIDDVTGTIIQNNVRRSFIVLDTETQGMVDALKAKVNANLLSAE